MNQTSHVFVILHANYWARGTSLGEMHRAYRKLSGKAIPNDAAIRVRYEHDDPKQFRVNEMGWLHVPKELVGKETFLNAKGKVIPRPAGV